MQAIVAQRDGGPEVLDLLQQPEPTLGPTDVLIAVRAAGLNPLDDKIRNRHATLVLWLRPSIGFGCDVAGVIAGAGARVSRSTAGHEVYARLEPRRMGGLAERVAADEHVVALKPVRARFAEAAAVPVPSEYSIRAADLIGRWSQCAADERQKRRAAASCADSSGSDWWLRLRELKASADRSADPLTGKGE
jgi:hypothetical protein